MGSWVKGGQGCQNAGMNTAVDVFNVFTPTNSVELGWGCTGFILIGVGGETPTTSRGSGLLAV